MGVRVVALLIPLAIVLPQLQASRPTATALEPVVHVQPAAEPEWSYETRYGADLAQTRVVLEAPAREAMRSTADSPAPVVVLQAAPAVNVRVAPSPRPTHKVLRTAWTVKGTPTATAAAPPRLASRNLKRLALGAGCEPGAHCAPVEDAKVTLVNRRAM